MQRQEFDARWREAAEEAFTGIRQWREAHPRATLTEMEDELDARLSRLRAQVLQEVVLTSPAADWSQAAVPERPVCPDCQVPLSSRGRQRRGLRTTGDQPVPLERSYGVCPRCQRGFFPSG